MAGLLSIPDIRFSDLSKALKLPVRELSIKERIQYMAKLDALVAHHYGVTRDEYSYIINSFPGFEEDEKIIELNNAGWNDSFIRKFNGEVRKRALFYYDEVSSDNPNV